MDEYLFITMAKLKADRRRLEQQERQQTRWRRPDEQTAKPKRIASTTHEFVPLPNWREQS